MKELLELETRRKIYNLILRNPGLHLSKISEVLRMRTSLVEYHIFYLAKNEMISIAKEGGYNRYYVKGKTGSVDKKILSLLRQELPLRIVLFLLKNKNAQHKTILKNFDVAPSTLSYHLKKLVQNEIITVTHFGENRGYTVNNREQIVDTIMRYKPYSVFEGFHDIWVDLSVE